MSRVTWKPVPVQDVTPEWMASLLRARSLTEDAPELQEARQMIGAAPGQRIKYHVAVEIPDYPMFHLWMQWATSRPSGPPVIMTSREQWRHRPDELQATVTSLLRDGRPEPIWKGIWSRVPADGRTAGA